MKLPKLLPEKKLKATARRMPQKAMEEYDEEEPAMKFSSAFIVVLLLHVTAFGGIAAFNKIKEHRVAPYENLPKASEVQVEQPVTQASLIKEDTTTPHPTSPAKAVAEKSQSGAVTKADESVPATHEAVSKPEIRVQDSGTLYTAVKGDNPVTIAHHFGVSYDDLLKLNNIENPKKLQIGQKLHIPVKH